MSDLKKGSIPIDTLAFTESLGLQTFRRNARNAWSKEEDALLLKRMEQMYPEQYARKTLTAQNVDWETVAEVFDDTRRGKDCRKRWTSSLDPSLRRGKWTDEEDRKLMELYNQYGPLWQQVALEIEGRTEHQCLKRFLEVLDPAQRNRLAPWSEAEEVKLIRLVKQHGTKWKTVAALFEGRPPLTIRNRWRNLVNQVARGRASAIILEEMSLVADGNLKSKINELAARRHDEDGRQSKKQKRGHMDGGPTKLQEILDDINMSLDTDHLRSNGNGEGQYGNQSEEYHNRNEEFRRGQNSQDTLHTQFRPNNVAERRSHVEWKYGLAVTDNTGTLSNLDHLQKLIESGGSIQSQQLAQHLVAFAAQHNMEITVHQHVHHHYSPPNEGNRAENGPSGHERNAHSARVMAYKADRGSNPGQFYNVEPESQINRYQHFNYLPPLTETPKLNSSASSPASSSKGSTHHYHHYHHHHHHHEENRKELTLEDEAATKESDLLKLLNEADGRNKVLDDDKKIMEESRSNSMTPLTQAVQMVAAAEAGEAFLDRNDGYEEKKRSFDYQDEEAEEGLDFFETMRNLNVVGRVEKPNSHNMAKTGESQHVSRMNTQPVSQHHPLHYFTSSVTPQPEKALDDEEEDLINSYGLFYNAYQKDTSMEQTTLLDAPTQYGAIPFNPS
ncbi:CIC11C00000000516 [Sungouiella intermedia]|uniref:CIC11C00000000516 n=1 Tax=Sungouiella intermedia TaxID=45354 RepID=A0A1L0CZP0_9ASCO|nr:CIC11C00000000516 [[Candida] intermedia]